MSTRDPTLDSSSLLFAGTADWMDDAVAALAARTGVTVTSVDSAARALAAFRSGSPDCLVTEYALDGESGLDLLGELRAVSRTFPVVVATASGSEAVASEAVAAGATEYVAMSGATDGTVADLVAAVERAVETADRASVDRDRARQFEALFDDAGTATWVLDADGALVRANDAALDLVATGSRDGSDGAGSDRSDEAGGEGMDVRAVDDGATAHVGVPFWDLPCWGREDELRTDVKRLVRAATDGRSGDAVVVQSPDEPDPLVVDLSVRPVENERGDLVSIVVEGVDVTDRVELERDLRQSEELHRVTLNNMTDTVLITDEAGEYTYVCPNVHFIFGYTAEEIRERGSITDLLGDDLFDRDELAAAGVLKNIECTAVDKAGREHTLLVNVREVAIQDGRLLFSCRDITKRKQREEALATLQETARELFYAETHEQIARQVVDRTAGVLDLDASAVYRFDADENALRPAASSPRMDALHGPLPVVHADSETLPGHSFVADEPLDFADVHDADRLENRATDLRSAVFVPLGKHGVFVAGTDRVDAFDDVAREFVDLLAATAEAALDRVSRETRLREQERQLQRGNDQLARLNRINATIREIDQALVRAETREEIDYAVCELLTADDRFSFAWIGAADGTTGRVEPRAWAGAEQGYLDSVTVPVAGSGAASGTEAGAGSTDAPGAGSGVESGPDPGHESGAGSVVESGDGPGVESGAGSGVQSGAAAGTEPTGVTAATGSTTVVSNVAADLRDDPWRTAAITRDFLSVLSIPLVYNDVSYGVLTVYAAERDAFDGTSRTVLRELGETIASAISAVERTNALLTPSITRVEFAVDDPTFVLSRLAEAAACTLTYDGGVRQTAEGSDVFVTVEDAPVERVADAATDLVAVEEAQRIGAARSGGVLRLRLSRPFPALELADHGAVFRGATADPDGTTIVVDVPERVDVRRITDLVRETFAAADLRAKRTVDRATEYDAGSRFLDRLTDRQLDVVRTAYYSGFFESPRERTGEEVATTLDISSTAFYNHVRAVQRKLFATLFDEPDEPAPADAGG